MIRVQRGQIFLWTRAIGLPIVRRPTLAADRALSELAELAYEVVPLAATGIFKREGRFGWKEPSSSLIWSVPIGFE